jgi:predicted Zn-dependent peptidase
VCVATALLVAAVAAPDAQQAAVASAQHVNPTVEFETFTLPNGLRVILHVDRKLPVVHVNEWYHVGS